MLEDTQKLMEEGKQEEALIEADKLIDYWDKLRNKSHFLVRCDKIGNINASIARIKPYIEEDNDELNAEFESVKEMLKWFYKSEMPYPNNIF